MNTEVSKILQYICKTAKDEEIDIGKTKLIKLLYLAEVEYYRQKKERLTDLTWKFYHFGPYPIGIDPILSDSDIEFKSITLETGQEMQKCILLRENNEYYDYVGGTLGSIINIVVKKWGDESLNTLLDYVYFETEPMVDAKRGDMLDFTKIKELESKPDRKIRIESKKLDEAKRKFKEYVSKLQVPKRILKFELMEEIDECSAIWDKDIENTNIKGKVILDL